MRMKDYFNFMLKQATLKVERRKSKMLLFALLTMLVGGGKSGVGG